MLNTILNIFVNYVIFMIMIGIPIFICFSDTRNLKFYQAVAILVFYPILAVLILIRVVIKTVKGLVEVIKMLK